MRRAIAETDRRRVKQLAHNEAQGITPQGVKKRIRDMIEGMYDSEDAATELKAAEQQRHYDAMSAKDLAKAIKRLEKAMQEHARNLEFEEAGAARDELFRLRRQAFGADPHESPEPVG
jgi:excinuclease ABC subunit B